MLKMLFHRENILDDDSSKAQAKKLVADGKQYAAEGELYRSLKCFKKAYKLIPSEKIMSRIQRIEVICYYVNVPGLR